MQMEKSSHHFSENKPSNEKTFFIMPHSHIDVEWYWDETITRSWSNHIFERALTLLKEDPEFCFTQDQTLLLQWFWESLDKREKAAFIKTIRGKRFALVGGMYVMPDVSVPNGECLIRQILIGQKWLKDTFDLQSECGWFIDTFGQVPQIPQILKKAGYKFNVFWRDIPTKADLDKMPLDFYWRSPDGSRIFTHWLAGGYGYRPEQVKMILDHSKYSQVLIPYGDDVTIPILNSAEMKEDLLRLLDDSGIEGGKFQTSTILDYFKAVIENQNEFPEVSLDFNPPYLAYDLRGLYENRIEIKKLNRMADCSLLDLEVISAIAFTHGVPYPKRAIGKLWKMLLFTQFHDTLGGSDSDPVHFQALNRLTSVVVRSKSTIDSTLKRIFPLFSKKTRNSILVFNTLSFPRTEVASFSLDLREDEYLAIMNQSGQSTPSRVIRDGHHCTVEFIAENVPALGMKNYEYSRKIGNPNLTNEISNNINRIENDHYLIECDPITGDLTTCWDKEYQRSVISHPGNVIVSLGEDDPDMEGMLRLNGKTARSSQFKVNHTEVQIDPIQQSYLCISQFTHCSIQRKIILPNHTRRIDFQTSILDYSGGDEIIKVSFPLNLNWKKVINTYETPFAATPRPDGHFAGQNWADCSDNQYGVTLFNYGCPGYWIGDGNLELVLLRSFSDYKGYQENGLKKGISAYEHSTQTERANEHGSHHYRYSLCTHAGSDHFDELSRIGQSVKHPLYTIKGGMGDHPSAQGESFLSVSPGFLMTSLSKSGQNEYLVFRGYETSGKRHPVQLHVSEWVRFAVKTNLLEEIEEELQIRNGTISFSCNPHEIVTILLGNAGRSDWG